jgi:hypothetical protein
LSAGLGNKIYPFPVAPAHLDVQMYWHENAENDPANRGLRDQIEAVISSSAQTLAVLRRSAAASRPRNPFA